MQVEFGPKDGSAAAPVVDVTAEVIKEPVETQAMVKKEVGPVSGYDIFTADDDEVPGLDQIVLPRINLVQNIGQLKDQFSPGVIVFNRALPIFEPPIVNTQTGNIVKQGTKPLNLTVLRIPKRPRYAERKDGGARGLLCHSEDQVRANGGTTSYSEWELKKKDGMKLFQILADALVAIERPEHCIDDGTVFIYDVDGKKYALALWSMKGTAYTEAAKKVFQTQRAVGCLARGYPTFGFSVSTRFKTYDGGRSAWVPVCIPSAKSSPAFLDFAAAILGGHLTPSSVPGADDGE